MQPMYPKGITKNEEKLVRSLQHKKYRRESGLFVAEGETLSLEFMKSPWVSVKKIFALKFFFDGNHPLPPGAECYLMSEKEMERISFLSSPSPVLVCAEIPPHSLDMSTLGKQFIPVLDDIRDPGNLGTLIRVADWFGIDTIICSEDTADAYNPKVVQASMGSIARVRLLYCNLPGFLQKYKEQYKNTVYGTFLSGSSIYESNIAEHGLLLIGNESRGISEEVARQADKKISIPCFRQGTVKPESLNAAVSMAVFCSEWARKK